MSIVISHKDTATLYSKSNYKSKNEIIYVRYVEAVQKMRSRVLSGLKTRGATPARFLNRTYRTENKRSDERTRNKTIKPRNTLK